MPPIPVTSSPPAVVLGSGLTALGVTRSLARADIPVFHLCPRSSALLESSRWYRPIVDDPPPVCEDDPELLGTLLREHVRHNAVLFPCSDAFVVAVASMSSEARDRYRACLADREVLEMLVNKSTLAELASRADVPHPRTARVESDEDLRELDESWFRDSLLKPVDSLRFFRRFGVKSLPVASRDEALEARRWFQTGRLEAVLQRYVPGTPSAHLFLDGYRSADGRLEGLLVRRRERMYPSKTGNSSSTVTVPVGQGAEAAESLKRLFEAVGFHGIFSAEFKEDGEDGTPRLLEVNVRPWWYVEFAARCGINVCKMAYREALGEPIDSSAEYDVGRRCVYTYYDLYAGWNELRADRLTVLEWMGSWVGSDRAIFSWDDPMPALAAIWGRMRQVLRRRLGRPPRPDGPSLTGI